jgi:membrane associated rhomboid family serine protease
MFVPYRVDVPMARVPWANLLLIVATIIISVLLFGPLDEWSHTLSTVAVAPAGAAQIAPPPAPGVLRPFILQPQDFDPVQLVGHLFAHAGWAHLLGNMFFLWMFGNAVNAKIGHWQYLSLYLGVGILEGLICLAIGPRVPALGASGAIMGIVGAFLLLYPLNDICCWVGWQWFYGTEIQFSSAWLIAAYVALDMWGAIFHSSDGIGYLAHVAGFFIGAGVTTVLLYRGVLEPARGERTLLQVLGLMPDNEEEELLEQPRIPRIPLTARFPARRQDTGPLPLD